MPHRQYPNGVDQRPEAEQEDFTTVLTLSSEQDGKARIFGDAAESASNNYVLTESTLCREICAKAAPVNSTSPFNRQLRLNDNFSAPDIEPGPDR